MTEDFSGSFSTLRHHGRQQTEALTDKSIYNSKQHINVTVGLLWIVKMLLNVFTFSPTQISASSVFLRQVTCLSSTTPLRHLEWKRLSLLWEAAVDLLMKSKLKKHTRVGSMDEKKTD